MQRFRNNFGIASHLSSFLHLSMPQIDFVGPASFCCQFNKKRTAENRPSCDPLGARTQDPSIKSAVLYQLS